MTFNEALQELLKGKKVRRVKWAIKEDYIALATSGYIVWNDSTQFNPNTDDITGDWEEYHSLKSGSRFVKDGKYYRLIKDTDGTYAILDEESYVEQVKGMTEESLMRDLAYFDFDIA